MENGCKSKKNLGFGFMRLPMRDGEVDYDQVKPMVDAFLESGFHYFDTAHGYLNGKSETALRECLTSRYPRERYVLANKLSNAHFTRNEDIRPLFESQLQACGVEYFDYYLMHAQNRNNFVKYKNCRAYETALELLREGRIRHLGISFHDKAEVLERILTEYPQIEAVQIQFNYVDYEDPSVEAGKCYQVCRRLGKQVIVMEPVKGGRLAALPEQAGELLDRLGGGSNASYALRFAAGFEGVMMVLSGMGSMEMLRDNLETMRAFQPLNERERAALDQVRAILEAQDLIDCTDCCYCTERCPQKIAIPDVFSCLNDVRQWRNWNADGHYALYTKDGGKASDCIQCGECEAACPQHLEIRALLKEAAGTFER